MDQLTINNLTFTLMLGTTPVSGTVNYSSGTATFTPTANLLSGSTYTATITTGAKNVSGNGLVTNYVWTFNTRPPSGPLPPDLKSVARFGIIAGVGVSNNAGFSVINNMDVGISPGARTGVTGFPPAIVVGGAIYASDDIAPAGTAAPPSPTHQPSSHHTEAPCRHAAASCCQALLLLLSASAGCAAAP